MPDSRLILGIDTSNYTTSLALCTLEGEVVLNLKELLPVKEGERGLRQSDALFAHTKNLPPLFERLKQFLREHCAGSEIVAVGYSKTPRDVEGSYMPCFLSGVAAASAISAALGCPSYAFSHQNGHIMAALYSADRLDLLEGERFLAFHVSGGTTEAVIARPVQNGFSVELVGKTADVSCGQAIDRVGVSMGLDFPCGRELEALAKAYKGKIYKHRTCVRDGVCSLSGVENIAARIYAQSGDRQAVAAFVFDFLCETLRDMCRDALCKHGEMPVIFAGGVMSNTLMRKRLSDGVDAYFCEAEFSADNAAGIALLCKRAHSAENGE